MLDATAIPCEECRREVDEFTAIKERWHFRRDGRDLLPYCPQCARREFGGTETEPVPLAHPRAATNGS